MITGIHTVVASRKWKESHLFLFNILNYSALLKVLRQKTAICVYTVNFRAKCKKSYLFFRSSKKFHVNLSLNVTFCCYISIIVKGWPAICNIHTLTHTYIYIYSDSV